MSAEELLASIDSAIDLLKQNDAPMDKVEIRVSEEAWEEAGDLISQYNIPVMVYKGGNDE